MIFGRKRTRTRHQQEQATRFQNKVDAFLDEHSLCETCLEPSERVSIVDIDIDSQPGIRLGAFCLNHDGASRDPA